MLLAAVTAAVKVVTPTVDPTVVPRALKHQNTAIAAAAMARAKNLRGAIDSLPARGEAKMSFAIPLTLPFFPRLAFARPQGQVVGFSLDRGAKILACVAATRP
jgi:hypothetical protein